MPSMRLDPDFAEMIRGARGIIHAGAHHAEEYHDYTRLGISHILMFEPIPQCYAVARTVAKNAIVECVALGDREDFIDINLAPTHSASSSILKPKLHLEQYPDIVFDRRVTVPMITLDSYFDYSPDLAPEDFTALNMDVQGYELHVLRGALKTLPYIRTICLEVNRAELYEGCAQISEIDAFLTQQGYRQEKVIWLEETWGTGIYCQQ